MVEIFKKLLEISVALKAVVCIPEVVLVIVKDAVDPSEPTYVAFPKLDENFVFKEAVSSFLMRVSVFAGPKGFEPKAN